MSVIIELNNCYYNYFKFRANLQVGRGDRNINFYKLAKEKASEEEQSKSAFNN